MVDIDTRLAEIHGLAATALREPNLPTAVADALGKIVTLTAVAPGDTPEPSDIPATENQSL